MNNSNNGHNDQLAEILNSLREWIIKTEKRLAELECAIKAKNDIDPQAWDKIIKTLATTEDSLGVHKNIKGE
jgi:hypothetical protein